MRASCESAKDGSSEQAICGTHAVHGCGTCITWRSRSDRTKQQRLCVGHDFTAQTVDVLNGKIQRSHVVRRRQRTRRGVDVFASKSPRRSTLQRSAVKWPAVEKPSVCDRSTARQQQGGTKPVEPEGATHFVLLPAACPRTQVHQHPAAHVTTSPHHIKWHGVTG